MAAFYDCMAAVAAAIGRRITLEEFDALYERLYSERDGLFARGYPNDWLAAARAVARQIETEKALATRQLILNKKVYQDGKSFFAEARRTVDAGRAIEARLVGINTPIAGGRNSAAGLAHGIALRAKGALLADLRRAAAGTDRLIKLLATPAYEEEIAKALRGEPAHPDAVEIARAIDKTREDLRRQENQEGGFRGRLDGYVTRQSHDSLKVRRAGFEQWKADILPRLDQDRTFDRQEELRQQLRHDRNEVLKHQLAQQAELVALRDNLERAETLDKKAGNRAKRYLKEISAERTAFNQAFRRFLELAGAGDSPERAAARADLERARARIMTRETKAGISAEDRQRLKPVIDAERQLVERATAGVELLNDLQRKMADYDKRLQGAVDPDAFLRRIHNGIAADTWQKQDSVEFKGLLKYIGPANMAQRRAAHRELHFKSAADEVGYMRQYGTGGVADSVFREIESAAHAIGTYRLLSTNPEAMVKTWVTEFLQEAQRTGNNALARQVTRRTLDWHLAELMGETRKVANPTVAAWASTARLVEGFAKLGGAMLSSFGDVATAAAELRYQGRGALESYGEMFAGLFKGRRQGETRVIAELLGVGFEGLSGQVLGRLGGESAAPGALARTAALYFRLNGLSWWTDTHKTTAGLVIARFFGTMKDRAYGALPAETQRLLKQFAIAPRDWDLVRKAALHVAEDGKEFLTPEGIRQIPLGWFLAHPEEWAEADMSPGEHAARQLRDRLADSYASLVADRVDHAVVTPGVRERALVNMGTQRGDLLGEALRFVMQFKSFGVAMVTRSIGRDLYGGGARAGLKGGLSATARLGFLAFQLGIFGYLAMSAKELLAGKNPRDPIAPGTWAAALAQGGGLGILGDFAFGEFNRFGQSALETAAGPTLGSVSDLFSLYAQARDPEGAAAGRYGPGLAAHGLRTIVSNTPYANLWWLRPALNYLALYPVQEALSPGYLQRMQNRIAKENKQTYWLPPAQTSPRL